MWLSLFNCVQLRKQAKTLTWMSNCQKSKDCNVGVKDFLEDYLNQFQVHKKKDFICPENGIRETFPIKLNRHWLIALSSNKCVLHKIKCKKQSMTTTPDN